MENTSSSNFMDSRGSETSENSGIYMDLSSEDFRRRKTIGVIIRRGLKDRVVYFLWSLKVYDHFMYKIIDHLLSVKDRMISLEIVYLTSIPFKEI